MLENSRYAKEALQLALQQETTKQKEKEADKERLRANMIEREIQMIRDREESQARMLQKEMEMNNEKSKFEDQLTRRREQEKIEFDEMMFEKRLSQETEEYKAREKIKKESIDYEQALRKETELLKVQAEKQARIEQERDNHYLKMEEIHAQSDESRKTIKEAIELAGSVIGSGLQNLLTDKEKLMNTAATITTVAFGIYIAKVSTGVAGRIIEAYLGKPALVRETTKMSILQMIKHPIKTYKLTYGSAVGEKALKNIVLAPELEDRLKLVASSTANTKKNKAPFRHLLLHGPPGTGKTMFAKGLARESGLHYAIMTGGDIAPLGRDAVTEIHKLFDWSNTTRKGVLLFVDEADAFLRKRSTEKISEDSRNALNAFLYRTGEASHKFMVVYASNQPDQFDWAINDRIDEMIEFKLPDLDERFRMIQQYINQYIKDYTGVTITHVEIDENLIQIVAEKTDGYSGREISKLAIAWQAAALGTPNALLSKELLLQVLENNIETKRKKQFWLSKDEVNNLTVDSQREAKKQKDSQIK